MKISYLITYHNETITLKNLIEKLLNILGDDELVLLRDNTSPITVDTESILSSFQLLNDERIRMVEHPLNFNYGEHKNWGSSQCSGEYIFQIDGDELPSDYIVGDNLHSIIETNNNVELIFVPRINDFRGMTPEHALQWGWRLSLSPTYNRLIVNWPDYQGRIFKNDINRIKWERRLHEKLTGYLSHALLPASEEYALYHDKTIEKQIKTNLMYNTIFNKEENMGHSIV